MRKKEIIYVLAAFFMSLGHETWIEIAHNEPSTILRFSLEELMTVAGISMVFVLGSTLITWLSYLSDPHEATRRLVQAPPGSAPPVGPAAAVPEPEKKP